MIDGQLCSCGRLGCAEAYIGLKAIELYSKTIRSARTVVWNGPMGKIELAACAAGTKSAAQTLVGSPAVPAGGGESAEAVEKFGLTETVSRRLDRRCLFRVG